MKKITITLGEFDDFPDYYNSDGDSHLVEVTTEGETSSFGCATEREVIRVTEAFVMGLRFGEKAR